MATTNKTTWKSAHENDGLAKYGGSRDMLGYGDQPPSPKWPNNAKVALNFVINYEEGGEKCLLHGDNESEHLLSEIVGAQPLGTFLYSRLFTFKRKPNKEVKRNSCIRNISHSTF